MARRKSVSSSLGAHPSGPDTPVDGEPTHRAGPSKPFPAGLYLVATPIGNAADISLRALDILRRADVVACEDTRTTGRLLTIHGIKTTLSAYHDHNAARAGPSLIKRLNSGQTVALVSDAGTPLVSDPGYRLVQACIEQGVPVMPVPGASSVLAALVVSGLPSDRFLFAGFLPSRTTARRGTIDELKAVPATLVFMESPRRLPAALADLADILGDRPAAVTRELTKLYEETRRGTLASLAEAYAESGPPKGEVVIVIAPPSAEETADAADADTIDRQLRDALRHQSLRDAAAMVAQATGMPRRQVYARALALGREPPTAEE